VFKVECRPDFGICVSSWLSYRCVITARGSCGRMCLHVAKRRVVTCAHRVKYCTPSRMWHGTKLARLNITSKMTVSESSEIGARKILVFPEPQAAQEGKYAFTSGPAFSQNVEARSVNPRLTVRTPEPWTQHFVILGVEDDEDARLDWPLSQ
jgi:hypothetical protein